MSKKQNAGPAPSPAPGSATPSAASPAAPEAPPPPPAGEGEGAAANADAKGEAGSGEGGEAASSNPPAPPAAPPAAPAPPPAPAPERQVPERVTVRNNGSLDVAEPISGKYIPPGGSVEIVFADRDHAIAVIDNLLDIRQRTGLGERLVIEGLPD